MADGRRDCINLARNHDLYCAVGWVTYSNNDEPGVELSDDIQDSDGIQRFRDPNGGRTVHEVRLYPFCPYCARPNDHCEEATNG